MGAPGSQNKESVTMVLREGAVKKDRHDRHGLNPMRQVTIAKNGWSCKVQFHPFLSKQG